MIRRVFANALLVALFTALVVAGAGCATRHHIAIQSNTCWIATIDRQNTGIIHDCGSMNYRVAGDIHCVAITNLNDTGYVRIRVDDGAWSESTAPRGTTEACR